MNAEVIRLPSYLELLDLPPAKEMPGCSLQVHGFNRTKKKRYLNIASFSTAVTQGGQAMVIDALKTAGNKWFRE